MGYYDEKEKYEEANKPQVNKCPECKKGIMVVTINQKGGFRGMKHVFKSFCPVCGHTIKKEV